MWVNQERRYKISIHASAKEATRLWDSQAPIFYISIHASAKEATTKPVFFFTVVIFQSTPPRRRRQTFGRNYLWINLISIHASAKEATISFHALTIPRCYFNPRLREGGDPTNITTVCHCNLFQSTPPRRRRLVITITTTRIHNFNPRLREGGDFCFLLFQHFHKFQSTPPRRRRLSQILLL